MFFSQWEQHWVGFTSQVDHPHVARASKVSASCSPAPHPGILRKTDRGCLGRHADGDLWQNLASGPSYQITYGEDFLCLQQKFDATLAALGAELWRRLREEITTSGPYIKTSQLQLKDLEYLWLTPQPLTVLYSWDRSSDSDLESWNRFLPAEELPCENLKLRLNWEYFIYLLISVNQRSDGGPFIIHAIYWTIFLFSVLF